MCLIFDYGIITVQLIIKGNLMENKKYIVTSFQMLRAEHAIVKDIAKQKGFTVSRLIKDYFLKLIKEQNK